MSKPLIAIVGRPNVGKSSLFNRLARRRIAITEDMPGTTRDRLYADCEIWGRTCTIIDTGGLDVYEKEGYTPAIVEQAQLAIDEADIIVFLLDGREEPTSLDYEVADILRRTRKPVLVAANKVDNPKMPVSNLNALRLGDPVPLSALAGNGVAELTEQIEELLPPEDDDLEADPDVIRVALVGRPNVGKSSITNRLLGFDRSMVSPVPGTTRDAIDTSFEWKDQRVTLIDTAGMRRKARVKKDETSVEYHMVLRALRAVDRCDVTIIVCQSDGITDQDTKIAGYAHEAGKAVLVAVNKWDIIEDADPANQRAKLSLAQKDFSGMLEKYLPFISYAPVHFISAQTGYGVEAMFDDALEISGNLRMRVGTGVLNDTVRRAIAEHPPASVKGRQVKIRYATQAEVAPPTIIIFSNRPEDVHFSYARYLENQIRARFPFRGVPLKIEIRKGSGEQTKQQRLETRRVAGLAETLRLDNEKAEAKAARQNELLEGRLVEDDDIEAIEFDMDEELDGDFEDDFDGDEEEETEVIQAEAPPSRGVATVKVSSQGTTRDGAKTTPAREEKKAPTKTPRSHKGAPARSATASGKPRRGGGRNQQPRKPRKGDR